MSKLKNGTQPTGHEDQHMNAGRDFYNPNPAQELYDREFNGIAANLTDVRDNSKKIINDNADPASKNTDDVRQKELYHPSQTAPASQAKSTKLHQLLLRGKLRGKTSLITVALVLFGGGGAVSIFASPSLAIVQLRQVLTQDLNDQLKAFDNRHAYLLRTKLGTLTNGSCGAVKIACRFSTMSDRQVEKYAAKGIVIERDMKGSALPNRGRVTSMTFPNPDGESIRVSSAADLANRMRNDTAVRSGMQRAANPWFASMTDKTMKTTLKLLGTSKSSRINGSTNEERERAVNNAVGASENLDRRNLTPQVDDEGKETGNMLGPDGEVLTPEQIKTINESDRTAKSVDGIKPNNIAASIGKGVMITGAVDSACTVYNSMRMVGALAKTEKARQAAQMAMATLLVPADKIMAGDGIDGEAEFIGNKINNIGGPEQPEEVVDETKLYDTNSDKNIPTKKNTDQYATAFDSPGVKAALHGDVIELDSKQARFSLAGGFIGTLNKVNSFIASAVSGGNPDPKVISSKCKYIQNPYVRGAALVAGIFVGIGTFGLAQAAGIAASLAISMALPYALSMAADILAGDVFKNLYGSDFGSGSFVGTASIMSTAAQQRGMKPLSAQEAVAYTHANQETLARYADTERSLARSEPFNVYNQYSFLGSLATTLTPNLIQSRGSASMMAMGIINLVPTTFASLSTPTKADNSIERFQQCEDPGYKELGIGADIYCNVRYGLSDKELAIDPVENAIWMQTTGNVAADDEIGEPIDNGQPWNYKKFIDECVNRTVGYGEDQEENSGDGSNCLSSTNEPLNERFRIFTMDRTVADYMDSVDEVTTTSSGSTGPVSAEGWAYPTTQDAIVTSTYKDASRGDNHRGIDLAQPGSALGKPIFAAYDGKVVASGPASGFGNWIVIEHTIEGTSMSTVYGHMKAEDLMVRVGDSVKAGQQIARIGNEGQSSGPHLHFELWNGNRLQCGGDCSLDPLPIISKAKSESGTRREGLD